MKEWFLLDPEVIFLNHGSFGAVPRLVFQKYQEWQRLLEAQPVDFLTRKLPEELNSVKSSLGKYLAAEPDNLLIIPNATYGVNLVARSINFQPGDEILTTDHEYGACINALYVIAEMQGVDVVQQPIRLPAGSPEEILHQLWEGVSPKTRLIFISHLTSPTAVQMPIDLICSKARLQGIRTLIDGAHAPGQLDINLNTLCADYYTGNCHKWMLAPKGSAFLHVREALHDTLKPLIVSWGWNSLGAAVPDQGTMRNLQWTGTFDPSSFLSIKAAIDFLQNNNWDNVRHEAQRQLNCFLNRMSEITGIPRAYSPDCLPFVQMAVAQLPLKCTEDAFQNSLRENYAIEVPIIQWNGKYFLRASFQAYNTEYELEKLIQAIDTLLFGSRSHSCES